MYARYTELEFDTEDREQVLAVWSEIGIPSASTQPGWRGATIMESEEHPGTLRLVTLWDAQADFERYYTGAQHHALSAAIKGSGMRGKVRDGLTAHHAATPGGDVLRLTRASVPLEGVDAVETYWRDIGGPLTRAADGCLRAEAYWSAPGQFEMVVAWVSRDHASAFLSGPRHVVFKEAMDALGTSVTERIVGDRIA